MTMNANPISVTYSDETLCILVEEYIAMQKADFTFKDVCSYILYRAMEEEKTNTKGLYESNQLDTDDCNRVSNVLEKIVSEGRLIVITDSDNKIYKKTVE